MAIPSGFRALPLPIAQLSLAAVLKCGQSFRWTAIPLSSAVAPHVEYRLALRDRVVCLRQTPDTLFYRADGGNDAETLAWLREYFQLDVDLVGLYDAWGARDPVFGKLRGRFEGIRMLRQDPWENLVSFICSQNNHITRITRMVEALCTHFSPPLAAVPHPADAHPADASRAYHPFPSPATLASPAVATALRGLGFGYRAPYIQRTAALLVDAHGEHGVEPFLVSLRTRSTDDARTELLRCVGVGRKVADCVLLMSLDKHDVVPVDTHVHQIAMRHYGLRKAGAMTPRLYDEVQMKLAAVWGAYAGWAHSVLFTADLKAFATYGLPTPEPTPVKARGAKLQEAESSVSPMRKRKRAEVKLEPELMAECVATVAETVVGEAHADGLADRVKRRRRKTVAVGSYVESVPA